MTTLVRDLMRPTLIFSIERAKRDLQWTPQFDIERGMADSYRWYRESGYSTQHPPDFSVDDEVLATLAESVQQGGRTR